jgi:hypothetical protein
VVREGREGFEDRVVPVDPVTSPPDHDHRVGIINHRRGARASA